MPKFIKGITDLLYCPKLPEGNFLNDNSGIQALEVDDVIPYCLVNEDLPLILPKRQDEPTSGVGEGVNDSVVLEGQFSVGAGSIVNQAINFLMIPRLGGDVTITYTAAEVWTIVCEADVAKSLQNLYFEFDVFLAAKTVKKYFVWFNVNAEGAEPTPVVPYGGARTAVPVALATGATAQAVSDAVTAAIDALTDVSAANGGGASTTVTVTNDQDGGVDDAHDIDTTFTMATTTQGRTKVKIVFDAASFEQQDFGFQAQADNAANDRVYTLTGVTIAEHTLACEHEGMMTEDISYMVAGLKEQYGAVGMIAKGRNPYGVLWTKGLSPYGNKSEVKNHSWATVNENLTLDYPAATPIELTWFGFNIHIENEISHNRDGGGKFASGIDFNKRTCIITINVQPEDYILYMLSRKHWLDYTNDLVLQIKSAQAGDANVYVQFDCDKCWVQPFDEEIKGDGSPEQYDIDLKPCPGATFKYTLEGYLSNEYFGGASS